MCGSAGAATTLLGSTSTLDNRSKPHRYLVVLDVESDQRLEDDDLVEAFSGKQWSMEQLPVDVDVVATLLSSTNLASPFRLPYTSLADVIEHHASDKGNNPHG